MSHIIEQLSLFNESKDSKNLNSVLIFELSKDVLKKLDNYSIEQYVKDVETDGLSKTWDILCSYILQFGEKNDLINISNFGEMYEIGLATEDKIKKKKSGQYYTPDDVAMVMSQWLDNCDGDNVCDVACGTGKLILTYLDYIGKRKALNLLKSGRLYLYDYDATALKICKTSLLVKYGQELCDSIHDVYCDFLDKDVVLPDNCKTISNPPYAAMQDISDNWLLTDVIRDSHEWYSSFMDKIFSQSKSTVIITPYSFVSGSKFYSLRKEMCELGNGFIVIFDNVPGNIFCGRKHGIFNTNTANSVRAAITVLNSSKKNRGFRVSPMIRFKNEERKELLKCDVLESTINDEIQIVNDKNKSFKKVSKELKNVYDVWINNSSFILKDLISKKANNYLIDMPNTCRYNTTASSTKLKRGGSITLYANSEDEYYFLYCFINSSFAYWWWRIYDGGITYPSSLLNSMPVPFNMLSTNDKEEFKKIACEMIDKEKEYVSTKVNAGVVQENIKFPEKYKNIINSKILQILGCKEEPCIFNQVHANKFFIDCEDSDGIK